MIGVKGQYIFIFNLGDKKDFVQEADLIEFRLMEEAGNGLPTFKIEFITTDPDIPRLLNEGNELNVSFGKDFQNDIDDTKLLIQHSVCQRQGVEKIHCLATGMLSKIAYHKNNLFISNKQDGVSTIKEIASKTFIFDSNVTPSLTDKMNWIQHNISDKKFVNDVWLHTYIPNSFLAIGISIDNKFILRDIKKKFQTGLFDWRLSTRNDTSKDIVYDGDYSIESKAGFINAWTGYKRIKGVYDLEDGDFSEISHEVKPIMALTNKLMRNIDIENKNAELGFKSDNVHSNYWKGYLANLSSLALFSTVSIKTSFQNQFKKIRVLDSVMFKEVGTDGKGSMEYSSGLYIVTKVVRILSNRQFITCLEMCRESHNQPLGNIS